MSSNVPDSAAFARNTGWSQEPNVSTSKPRSSYRGLSGCCCRCSRFHWHNATLNRPTAGATCASHASPFPTE
eukprot:8069676-Lingulodinium_polyedra.AAC.1